MYRAIAGIVVFSVPMVILGFNNLPLNASCQTIECRNMLVQNAYLFDPQGSCYSYTDTNAKDMFSPNQSGGARVQLPTVFITEYKDPANACGNAGCVNVYPVEAQPNLPVGQRNNVGNVNKYTCVGGT